MVWYNYISITLILRNWHRWRVPFGFNCNIPKSIDFLLCPLVAILDFIKLYLLSNWCWHQLHSSKLEMQWSNCGFMVFNPVITVNLLSHISCISYTFPPFFYYYCNVWMSIFIFLMISCTLTVCVFVNDSCILFYISYMWAHCANTNHNSFWQDCCSTYDLIIRFNACPTSINVCTQNQAKYYLCELTSITLFHVKSWCLHSIHILQFIL